MASSIKMTSFWDNARYSFIEVVHSFRGAYCLHQGSDQSSPHLLGWPSFEPAWPASIFPPAIIALMMEPVSISEKMVNFYDIT
jgi:hypothetical protein